MEGRCICRIFLTTLLTTCILADRPMMNKGVVFVNQGNFLLTTSRWTLVVDLSFEEYDIQLLRLQEHLDDLKRITREAQIRNTGSVLWSYTAAEVENLERVLREQNEEYQDLKSLVTVNTVARGRRALIDFGGKVLKFLFGTATSTKVEVLNNRVSQIQTNQESIVHILEAQATVLNETLMAVKENRRHIKMLLQGQEYLSQTMHSYSYSLNMGTALRYMESAVAEFRSQLTKMRAAIELLEQGRLGSYFVPRQSLLTALSDINNHLPADMTLIEPVRPDNLFKYYQLITVTAVALPNTLRLFIDIPLMNPDQFFDLFEVVSFPVHYPSINTFAYYRTEYPFIALSRNRQSYMLLNTYEVLKCRTGIISICSPESAIWQNPYRSCEYALFMGFDAVVAQICDKRLVTTHPPVFRRIDQVGTWIYSTDKPLSLVVECPRLIDTATHSKIVKLVGTNILNLPNSCTGHLPGIKLTAHFQQRSTLKLITKTHLIFPLVTDILNKTEIDLVQTYNNYTATNAAKEQTPDPIDLSLNTAEDTLQKMRLEITRLKSSVTNNRETASDYFREITSGTTGLLIIAVIVILILIRKQLRCLRIDCKKNTNTSRVNEEGATDVSPKGSPLREALELTPLFSSHAHQVMSENNKYEQNSSIAENKEPEQKSLTDRSNKHEQKLYPTL